MTSLAPSRRFKVTNKKQFFARKHSWVSKAIFDLCDCPQCERIIFHCDSQLKSKAESSEWFFRESIQLLLTINRNSERNRQLEIRGWHKIYIQCFVPAKGPFFDRFSAKREKLGPTILPLNCIPGERPFGALL